MLYGTIGPDDRSLMGYCADLKIAEAEAVIDRAHDSFNSWKQTCHNERTQIMGQWSKLILDNSEDLAKILTCENGKPLVEARAEIQVSASYIEYYAEEIRRLKCEVYQSYSGMSQIMNKYEPVGVCALITPWNFPSSMLTRKASAALAAGCSVVAKPDSKTPFSALAVHRLAIEAGIPESVFQVITCSEDKTADVGHLLATHSKISKLSFTGSTRVGRLLMSLASNSLKRLSLELGGHAPLIVTDNVDIDLAVDGIAQSRFRNNGQTCICANRIIIHESKFDEIVEKLKFKLSHLKVGSGLDPEVNLGPLINEEARSNLIHRIEQAVQKDNATIIFGGKSIQPKDLEGAFMEPTLITNVSCGSDLLRQEIFGPIAVLQRFSNDEEAINMANSSEFGLAAYVYCKDQKRALQMADRLEVGMVGINETRISTTEAPFGGIKQSGFGREGSREGLFEYMQTKYINIKI